MDSDAKYNKQQDDVVGSSQPTFLYDNNSYNLKPETIDDGGFSLQDFQQLDHLIPSYGSSDSPDLGTIEQHPYAADDPFDLPPYGFFYNNLISFYDAKPFAGGMGYGGGDEMVVDAFHNGGVGFMGPSLPGKHGACMIGGGDASRSMAGQQFFGYQQQEETLKPMSFVMSDELSCMTVRDVGCGGRHYKNGVGTRTTSKRRAVMPETTRRTCNRRENKKPNNNVRQGAVDC